MHLPALKRSEYHPTSGSRSFTHVRRFRSNVLPADAESHEGACFTIDAVVRSAGDGLRRPRLVTWSTGESVEAAIEAAAAAWKALPPENDWEAVEVDLPSSPSEDAGRPAD